MTRDRIKMLGLVLLCASLTLAILLPAIGIQKLKEMAFFSTIPAKLEFAFATYRLGRHDGLRIGRICFVDCRRLLA